MAYLHGIQPYEVMGYVYEADIHCHACTEERFPDNTEDHPAVDNEGNQVTPLFAEYGAHHEPCGTCHLSLF